MTILERELYDFPPSDPIRDRRRTSAGQRVSWASAQPFVQTSHDDHPTPETTWRTGSGVYVRRLIVVDLAVALVMVPLAIVACGVVGDVTAWWSVATAATFLMCVAAGRGYDRRSIGDGAAEFQAVLRGGALAVAAIALGSVALAVDLPRLLVLVTITPLIIGTAGAHYALRKALHARRGRGEAMSRTLVVGDGASVQRLITDLRATTYHGYNVVGMCLPSITDTPPQTGVPLLGALADIPQVAIDNDADVVIVSGSELAGEALRRLSWALGSTEAQLVLAPGLVEVLGPRVQVRPTAGLSLLEVQTNAPRRRMLAKSVLDRTAGTVFLLLAAPVIGLAALAVRLTSDGHALFRQRRIGIDGREFTMWKLRSMYADGEVRRDALLSHSDRDGLMFKMHDDPRITPVGRILRRYSIDELPQLWNVVRGDMSIVGPRPPLPAEVDEYHDAVNRRLRVRPGLTGLWQVSGRADLPWDESVKLDLRYVDNWSLAMDLMILWKTGRAVIGGNGAY